MQDGKPVAFLNKALGEKHKHLSIYEKKFLALIMAVEKWKHYLQRQEFQILTDHKSLAYLSEQNLHSDMQQRAMTRLMGLQFKIIYRKGKENVAADALSRVAHLNVLQAVSMVKPDWLQEVVNSYTTDVRAQQLLQQLAITSPNQAGYSLDNGLISAIGGHSGSKVTYQRLRNHFAWKGMKQAVDDFVKQCTVCQTQQHFACRITATSTYT
jgi:hypothetical protein